MSLHGNQNNRDSGSYTKTWQNSFYQIVHQLQRSFDSAVANFVGTSNDINSKRAFLPHDPWIFFELVASTATNSALTITRKLGQRVLAVVIEERNLILAGRIFGNRAPQPDRIKAGSNITLTRKLGEVTIEASASGSLTVEELDGSPSVSTTTLQVQNGTLIDVGGGVATLGWMEPVTNGDPDFPEVLFDDTTGDIVMAGVTG